MDNLFPLAFLVLFVITGIAFGIKGYQSWTELSQKREAISNEILPNEGLRDTEVQIKEIYNGASGNNANDDDLMTLPISAIRIKEDQYIAKSYATISDIETKKVYLDSLIFRVRQIIQQTELFDKYAKTGKEGLAEAIKKKEDVKKRLNIKLHEMNLVHDKDIQNLRNNQMDIEEKIDAERAKHAAEIKQVNRELSTLGTEQSNLKHQMNSLVKRDRVRANLDSDGTVIYSDPMTRKVVIDIGSEQGVKPKMRFEVYNVSKNKSHDRITKGYIIVQEVAPTHSICLARLDDIRLGTDPVSGYTAKEPEERFSPMTAQGADVLKPQPLSGPPVRVLRGPSLDNPILEGDQIQCPFFERNKKLNFLVLGDKDLAYSKEHILRILKDYGCNIVDKVSPEVDLVLVRSWKIANENEELNAASQLGLKIVYEVEILPFLRD